MSQIQTLSNNIKVAHLTSVHSRYDTRIFIKQLPTLVRVGYDTLLLVADGRGNEEKNDIKIIDIGINRFGRIGRMTRTVFSIYKHALKLKADVYHFHDPELILVGLLLRLHGYKVIYDVHEDYPKHILGLYYIPFRVRNIIARMFSIFENFSSKYFSSIVSATPAIAKKFNRINKKSIIIQNFPILNELYDSETIPWETRSNAVSYVGGISKNRGVLEMVKAIEFASKKMEVSLILGGNFVPQELKEEIELMEGWKKTEYMGYLSREAMGGLFNNTKAGLVIFHPEPNHISAQPNKLFEYMSAGIPVIVSDFPLWREIVNSSGCGLLVNPMEPMEIADAIIYIIENPIKAVLFGKLGRKAIEEKYNWGVESTKLETLYKEILQH